ncbi:BQ5605_C019g09014 [Microbotryum silenes-dioicae]|uniref:serine--tRNA ligase n=1 Tax=Microbotryum silenes-dioicae TaxID=796604 RepID=A0A2X0M105_9BASI|nr:BQ5605_C019g09014 [Microbotryum silenes-dioicae]
MGIDLHLLQAEKGGDLEAVLASEKKRFAKVDYVNPTLALYKEWVKREWGLMGSPDRVNTDVSFDKANLQKRINSIQKEIGLKMKAKEDATQLKADKTAVEKEVAEMIVKVNDAEVEMRRSAHKIGNIVHSSDDNRVERTFHPDGMTPNKEMTKPLKGVGRHMLENILSHHEVMYRLNIFEMERGAKVAGHRGYYLTGDGVDLNQAMISYGLSFLAGKGYKKIQPPFFMNRATMAKTAQLEEFDEALYKIEGKGVDLEDTEKYLIATSEQPISALHMDEWFEKPSEQLPIRYAGYSTCFRKEAGSSGRDVLGIFRVHQFEKIEQFCITDPESSWEMFDAMIANSEAFYQSLGLPYQLISIVSGALNNAAAKKYDLEAWFPHQGEYKELVSVSNCTDYQSRTLEVRCGIKKQGENKKVYVHMLNGTLCATERALCCIVENYQTPEGLMIPEPLRPYMGGRDFIPYVRELPKPTKPTKK